ncbi:hypothetical protein HDG37_003078 [Paraburkholderia sp. MM5384-R2]|nr:hypothetical protein [Paraburkholderia sp. MM5384-R2]
MNVRGALSQAQAPWTPEQARSCLKCIPSSRYRPAGSPDSGALRLPHLPEQALDANALRGNVGMVRRMASWSVVTVLTALEP